MTKSDIVQEVCERVGAYSKKEAADLVDAALRIMKNSLERAEGVKISGFGNFAVREKNPRPGRNPKTGESLTIEARRVLVFRPSNNLKNALNEPDR